MITVFTPTYNRAELLVRLYNSLKTQKSSQLFEWLIVDDGSTDATKETVDRMISENELNITYIYQKNAGKYRAFNTGIENAHGDLFFCIDSDDYAAENMIDNIIKASEKIKENDIAGIIALKSNTVGKLLSDEFPESIQYADTYSLSQKEHCRGEWSLVYKTSILRSTMFPDVGAEKFVTESVLYDKIARTYKMYLLNKVLTICEYQDNGLTQSIFSTMLDNPTGYKIYYINRIDMALCLKERIGYAVRYNAFRLISDDRKYKYCGKHRLLVISAFPLGVMLKIYYFAKKKKKC